MAKFCVACNVLNHIYYKLVYVFSIAPALAIQFCKLEDVDATIPFRGQEKPR